MSGVLQRWRVVSVTDALATIGSGLVMVQCKDDGSMQYHYFDVASDQAPRVGDMVDVTIGWGYVDSGSGFVKRTIGDMP